MKTITAKAFRQFKAANKPKKKRKDEEHKIQVAFVDWFRLKFPKKKLLLFAVPNGAKLAGTPQQRAMQMNRLKAEGLTVGAADLFLSIPSADLAGLYIETKTEIGTQSKVQKEFEAAVVAEGFGYVIVKSLDEGIKAVESYLEDGTY